MPADGEARETKLKRLHMRSMRRGIREMDLILTAFAASSLDRMSDAELVLYDDLLNENDQDLYAWTSGRATAPARYADMIERIALALQRN